MILDVRRKSEFDSEHIVEAENIPLDYINQNMAQVPRDKTCYVHCAGGYRSMIFISILRARGYQNLVNVNKGFKAIRKTGRFPLTGFCCAHHDVVRDERNTIEAGLNQLFFGTGPAFRPVNCRYICGECITFQTMVMADWLRQPWPWYVAGPLIGIMVFPSC